MRTRVLQILGGLVLIGAMVLTYIYVRKSLSQSQSLATPIVTSEPRAASGVALVTAGLAVDQSTGTELGERLFASVPLSKIAIVREQSAAFDRDVPIWAGAFLSQTPDALQKAFETFGISPPSTWSSPQEIADVWKESLVGVRHIAFDEMRTDIRRVPIESVNKKDDVVKRCYQRDFARPFLRNEQVIRSSGVEVLLHGTVVNEEKKNVPVSFGLLFVWNPESKQWVLIKTCLYNFPNEVGGIPPKH